MQSKFILILGLAGLAACYFDSEEALYGQKPEQCDSAPIRYSEQVQSILQRNCYGCHSAGSNIGNLLLDSYTAARNVAKTGALLGSVRHSPGYSPMPKGAPKLRECDIRALQTWVDDGMPNN